MKIFVHKMHGCNLCKRCVRLLRNWNIDFFEIYDEPVADDREYPYITIDYEYGEIVEMIAKGELGE